MLVFRKMTEVDADQVACLEADIFSDAWTINSIQETLRQKQAFIAVAEMEGRIVGYCILYYVLDEGEIARIAVDKTTRKQGVGKGILDYVSDSCKKLGVERLLLDVRESNEIARRFYERYGFAVDGIRKNFYEQPKEHAVLMSKMLG